MVRSTNMQAIDKHNGFSMIELMVAMVLSLLLLAGVLSMFAGSRSSYETIDRWSRLQENGRYALDQVVRDVRSSGYLGCSRGVRYKSTTLNNFTDLAWDFSQMVGGFHATGATWSPTMDATVISPATGSDVLVLRIPTRDAVGIPLQSDMTSSAADLVTANISPAPFTAGDIAMITNCEAQSVFQVTSYSAGTITHTAGGTTSTAPGNAAAPAGNDLSYTFLKNSEIVPVHTVIYYVRRSTSSSDTTTVCSATLPCSLWRRIGLNTPEELIEGVNAMQVVYGVDTSGDNEADQYSTADTIAANNWWPNVVSVRVAMLVSSLDEYGGDKDTKTYSLLGTSFGPYNDRRIRQIFTSTISLRNRAT